MDARKQASDRQEKEIPHLFFTLERMAAAAAVVASSIHLSIGESKNTKKPAEWGGERETAKVMLLTSTHNTDTRAVFLLDINRDVVFSLPVAFHYLCPPTNLPRSIHITYKSLCNPVEREREKAGEGRNGPLPSLSARPHLPFTLFIPFHKKPSQLLPTYLW